MAKSNLEKAIDQAANSFALQVVQAVKGATLQELMALQGEGKPKKPGRKPASKPGPKPKGKKPGPKPKGKKPGPKPKAAKKAIAKPIKKKRIIKNYPKCAYPSCNNNKFVRGKGFCGDHWKLWLAGKIKSAGKYK